MYLFLLCNPKLCLDCPFTDNKSTFSPSNISFPYTPTIYLIRNILQRLETLFLVYCDLFWDKLIFFQRKSIPPPPTSSTKLELSAGHVKRYTVCVHIFKSKGISIITKKKGNKALYLRAQWEDLILNVRI